MTTFLARQESRVENVKRDELQEITLSGKPAVKLRWTSNYRRLDVEEYVYGVVNPPYAYVFMLGDLKDYEEEGNVEAALKAIEGVRLWSVESGVDDVKKEKKANKSKGEESSGSDIKQPEVDGSGGGSGETEVRGTSI